MKKPFISIIIPTWRDGKILSDCLNSLLKQDYPKNRFEIILVSKKRIRPLKNNIKSVLVNNNINHAEARNYGVKQARGEIIAFVDDDCLIPNSWLSKGVKYFHNQAVGLIGGPIPQPPNQKLTLRFGGYLMASPFGTGFGGLRWRIGNETKEASEIDLILANNMMRKTIFEEIRGFDRDQVPCEENLLYRQVLSLGYKILYIPELYVFHRSKPIFRPLAKKVFFYSTGRGLLVARFPKSFRLTYLLPSLFLSFLISFPLIFFINQPLLTNIALSVILFYFILSLINGIYLYFKFEKNLLLILIAPLGTFLIHTSYGLGFIRGLLRFWLRKKTAVMLTYKD